MCVCDVWSLLSPTWQVYIDDPDVANAAKENISVSFYASVGGIFLSLILHWLVVANMFIFTPIWGR